MKRYWIGLCGLALVVSAVLAQEKPARKQGAKPDKPVQEKKAAEDAKPAEDQKPGEQQPTLETAREKVSYGFGLRIGFNLKQQRLDLDPKLFAKGMADALAGRESLVSEEDLQTAMLAIQEEHAELLKKAAAENMQKGKEFLAANAEKEGVQTLKSGLQYLVIEEGAGESPTKTSRVKTHYRGTLLDGTVFDSSYEGKKPVVFHVDGVIAGWTEALQLMKVGAKWKLFIPADLAYKEQGSPDGSIGPNEVLIFEIELLGIEKEE